MVRGGVEESSLMEEGMHCCKKRREKTDRAAIARNVPYQKLKSRLLEESTEKSECP